MFSPSILQTSLVAAVAFSVSVGPILSPALQLNFHVKTKVNRAEATVNPEALRVQQAMNAFLLRQLPPSVAKLIHFGCLSGGDIEEATDPEYGLGKPLKTVSTF